jgi:hypothetical protein
MVAEEGIVKSGRFLLFLARKRDNLWRPRRAGFVDIARIAMSCNSKISAYDWGAPFAATKATGVMTGSWAT